MAASVPILIVVALALIFADPVSAQISTTAGPVARGEFVVSILCYLWGWSNTIPHHVQLPHCLGCAAPQTCPGCRLNKLPEVRGGTAVSLQLDYVCWVSVPVTDLCSVGQEVCI